MVHSNTDSVKESPADCRNRSLPGIFDFEDFSLRTFQNYGKIGIRRIYIQDKAGIIVKQTRNGFTLMEMLIVIAIIVVLIAIMIPVFASQLERAREAATLQMFAPLMRRFPQRLCLKIRMSP